MKCTSFLAAIAATTAIAYTNAISAETTPAEITTTHKTITPTEAFTAVSNMVLPAGVKLTGEVDPISMSQLQKSKTHETLQSETTNKDKHDHEHEQWIGGGLGLFGAGGYGGWGGWGGFGPYRFGFNCGGIGGYAYPLGFWNLYGAGLYGGSCGLGIPFGGLYWC